MEQLNKYYENHSDDDECEENNHNYKECDRERCETCIENHNCKECNIEGCCYCDWYESYYSYGYRNNKCDECDKETDMGCIEPYEDMTYYFCNDDCFAKYILTPKDYFFMKCKQKKYDEKHKYNRICGDESCSCIYEDDNPDNYY